MCVTCTKIGVKKTPCDDYGEYTNKPGNRTRAKTCGWTRPSGPTCTRLAAWSTSRARSYAPTAPCARSSPRRRSTTRHDPGDGARLSTRRRTSSRRSRARRGRITGATPRLRPRPRTRTRSWTHRCTCRRLCTRPRPCTSSKPDQSQLRAGWDSGARSRR